MSGIDYDLLAFPKKGKPRQRAEPESDETKLTKLRDAVWRLDKSRDRATGKTLKRASDPDAGDPELTGEVHHLRGRRVRPEWKFDAAHAILLSVANHRLADARGGRRLRIEGDDANGPLTFVLVDRKGHELWRRTSTRETANVSCRNATATPPKST